MYVWVNVSKELHSGISIVVKGMIVVCLVSSDRMKRDFVQSTVYRG